MKLHCILILIDNYHFVGISTNSCRGGFAKKPIVRITDKNNKNITVKIYVGREKKHIKEMVTFVPAL